MHAFSSLLFSLLISVHALASPQVCEPITSQETSTFIKNIKSQDKKIIFFAGWCAACVPYINEAKEDRNTILVGVFDDATSLNKAYKSLKTPLPCFISNKQIISTFKVSFLPYTWNRGIH